MQGEQTTQEPMLSKKGGITWPRFVLFNTLAWIGLAILTVATSTRATQEGISVSLFLSDLPRFLAGYFPYMLVSPIIYGSIYRRLVAQASKLVLARGVIADFLLFLVIHLPVLAFFWGYRPGDPEKSMLDYLALNSPYFFLVDSITFFAAYGIYYALAFARLSKQRSEQANALNLANQELELALKSSQLQLLRSQFEPHFLFNALNSISALVRLDKQDDAQQAIQQMSDLLRYSLKHAETESVPLSSELEFVRDYMALQKLRHGNKITFTQEHHLERTDHQVPPCLLQPVLENCVKHGLEAGADHVTIEMEFSEEGEDLLIRVRNTVPVESMDTLPPGLSLGLEALKKRLVNSFGEEASLETSGSPGSFLLTIRLPQGPE